MPNPKPHRPGRRRGAASSLRDGFSARRSLLWLAIALRHAALVVFQIQYTLKTMPASLFIFIAPLIQPHTMYRKTSATKTRRRPARVGHRSAHRSAHRLPPPPDYLLPRFSAHSPNLRRAGGCISIHSSPPHATHLSSAEPMLRTKYSHPPVSLSLSPGTRNLVLSDQFHSSGGPG